MHPSTDETSTTASSGAGEPTPGQQAADPWTAPPAFRRYLGDPGAQVHLHEAGTSEGAPVVLLHRDGGTGEAWADLMALGSWSARLLAPDLPGCGRSDAVGGGAGAQATHLLEALRHSEPRGLLLVAEGEAACLAVEMALIVPGAVVGLVLLSPVERTACDVLERLRQVTVPVWAAVGERPDHTVELPGARWLVLPGVGDEPVLDHADLVLDLVHGALAELVHPVPEQAEPQAGRRYITWVSSEAWVNPSLSR